MFGERVNIPFVLCEGSSLHAVGPFEEGTTETLQHLPASARFDTLCPRWHKVDRHRSQTSDEICKLVRRSVEERWSTQLTRRMNSRAQSSTTPRCPSLCSKMFLPKSSLRRYKNSSLSVAGVSPMQLVFGRNPEISGDFLSDNTTNQFSMTEMLDGPRE